MIREPALAESGRSGKPRASGDDPALAHEDPDEQV